MKNGPSGKVESTIFSDHGENSLALPQPLEGGGQGGS